MEETEILKISNFQKPPSSPMRTIYLCKEHLIKPSYINIATKQRLESTGEMLYTTFVTLAGEISCAIGDVLGLLCALVRLE